MIEGLSGILQRQIEQFKIACNIYNDLSSMWVHVQTSEQSNPQIDTITMRDLTEGHLINRLFHFHRVRANLSSNLLKQAVKDGVLTIKTAKKFTNTELIDTATTFISNVETNKNKNKNNGFKSFKYNSFKGFIKAAIRGFNHD